MRLLDTDIPTLAFHKHERVSRKMIEASQRDLLATTLVTKMQILQGRFSSLLAAADKEELARAYAKWTESNNQLARINIIGLPDGALDEFDRLSRIKSLRRIGRADLLLACIALAENATLVTRNLKDFRPVPGLKIENWAD